MIRTISLSLLLLMLAAGNLFADSHATISGALDVSALRAGQKARLAVVLDIADGYHAQSHTPADEFAIKCELTMDAVPGLEFGPIIYPAGKDENSPQLGKLNIYTGRVIILVPVTVANDAKIESIKITGYVQMQICNDESCFPPEKDAVEVDANVVPAGSTVEPRNEQIFTKAPSTQPASPEPSPTTQDSGPATNHS